MAVANLLKKTVQNELLGAFERVLGNSTEVSKLEWCLRFNAVKKKSPVTSNTPQLRLNFRLASACGLIRADIGAKEHNKIFREIHEHCKGSQRVSLHAQTPDLLLHLPQEHITSAVLRDVLTDGCYGSQSPWHQFIPTSVGASEVKPATYGQKVLIEYSSPNIAKHFHAGHIRSTVIGNIIGNINQYLGNIPVRVNYLGDWGTQFGFLMVGFEKFGSKAELEKDAMSHLLDVYVKTSKMAADTESGEDYQAMARQAFHKMEIGDPEALEFWEMCRSFSVSSYKELYKKIGVTFDQYAGEAMYFQKSLEIVEELEKQGFIEYNDTGVGFMDLTTDGDKSRVYANLVKSNGTTLYLTRDIAAALHRYEEHKFDKMHYVVENGQHLHFVQLHRCLQRLGMKWACETQLSDIHVKFGRVEGMSTRQGTAVLLRDILEEATTRMREKMAQYMTPRLGAGDMSVEDVAERLAVSAVIVSDLKHRRLSNYKFNWEAVLNFHGDTGVFLQYTHARLCRLLEHSGLSVDQLIELVLSHQAEHLLSVLNDPAPYRIVLHLARYPEVIHMAYTELEPCHIAQYLFMLCRLVSSALEDVWVKDQPPELSVPRMALYYSAQMVLANGITLLGLEPLSKI